jgi:hypothetical protein
VNDIYFTVGCLHFFNQCNIQIIINGSYCRPHVTGKFSFRIENQRILPAAFFVIENPVAESIFYKVGYKPVTVGIPLCVVCICKPGLEIFDSLGIDTFASGT